MIPEAQSIVTAAVTPVVMISANAILVSAISAKHQSMSDRLRSLAAEWRMTGTSDARRRTIAAEARLFNRRLLWITWSHITLYAATACFILMVIDIAVGGSNIALSLLIAGVSLTLTGIVLELFDLALARATVRLEIRDILQE